MTTVIESYYLAGLIAYLGYPLIEVRTQDRDTSFTFEIAPWSVEELQRAFDGPDGQPLTSARAYAESLQRLTALQRKARQNRDGIWTSRAWTTMNKETDEV